MSRILINVEIREIKRSEGCSGMAIHGREIGRNQRSWNTLELEAFDELFITAVSDFGEDNKISSLIKQYKPEIFQLFVKWMNFLHQLESAVMGEHPNGAGADIHRYNFAYDNAGNIKCIDT